MNADALIADDCVHPNDAGYEVILDAFKAAYQENPGQFDPDYEVGMDAGRNHEFAKILCSSRFAKSRTVFAGTSS